MTEPDKQIILAQEAADIEMAAHRDWKKLHREPLPLVLALKMYELYLNGYSCEEIWKINGEQHHLGKIVDAKIRYDWDKKKELQIAALYSVIQEKVVRVKNEAVSYLSDLLAAAHKMWGDKVKKYLQEGDPELLQGFDPSNLKNYKEILAMLNALTEAEAKSNSKEVKVDGTVNHVHLVTPDTSKKKMSGSFAHDLLKALDEASKDDSN